MRDPRAAVTRAAKTSFVRNDRSCRLEEIASPLPETSTITVLGIDLRDLQGRYEPDVCCAPMAVAPMRYSAAWKQIWRPRTAIAGVGGRKIRMLNVATFGTVDTAARNRRVC